VTAGRLIASLATVLLLVAGLGYVASQTLIGRPELVAQPPAAYVDAPSPPPASGGAGGGKQGGTPSGPPVVDPAWVAQTATAAGIPEPAVRAYATAQLARPTGCEIGWTTLAGIGWVESQHGTIDGRILGVDGHSSSPILGPALNGRGEVAAIRASPESSEWHGDPDWDHAVGPLQFIPSSWETWAADGDGDGVSDPNDLDDAAMAAVGYLCADGHDLTTGQGWADAVFSYNHAQEYIDAVHTAATAYAQRTS
jgi:membrane-bound lytic murein transglycosylase B